VQKVVAVVLAAGKGTRMKSALPKVLHRVCGRYMVEHVIESARQAGVGRVIAVIGHEAELVARLLGDEVDYVCQEEQMGTGHAVLVARPAITPEEEVVLVLCGDTPLITSVTLRRLLDHHLSCQAAVTILTSIYANPSGYGRIIRDSRGVVAGIVEEKDATPEERAVREINTGIYCFNRADLFQALSEIAPNNAQGEYYLTDCVTLATRAGKRVETIAAEAEETLGINSRVQLAQAEKVLRLRVLEELMLEGVTIVDPNSTFIDPGVGIEPDTVIYPFCMIEGETAIGSGCVIGPGTRIMRSRIGNRTVIENSVVVDSLIEIGRASCRERV
jgi:bifunctional UDP-N-acetylglucosamine pyrophosphorylase/glucosamine-1-phosphate N-acetyltransferase